MVQDVSARSQDPQRANLIAPPVPAHDLDVAGIIDSLSGEKGLTRGALRRAVENWDRVLPVFLDMLEAYIQDPDANEAYADALFFIVHLFGQMRETRAYPLLMRFAAMAPEHVERVLGDGITETFSRVAASVFDGDPQPMRDVILDERADEFLRNGLLEELALVTRDGRADRKSTEAFLVQCYADLKPQHDCYVWLGWQSAISYLGLGDLTDLVRRAFASGRIDPSIMSFRNFESDLAATRHDPAGAGRGHSEIGYFDDAIAEFSHWHAFSDTAAQSRPKSVDNAASPAPVVVSVGEAARASTRERPLSVRQREEIQEMLPRQVGPPYIRSRAFVGS
jgi:hypothetical protein